VPVPHRPEQAAVSRRRLLAGAGALLAAGAVVGLDGVPAFADRQTPADRGGGNDRATPRLPAAPMPPPAGSVGDVSLSDAQAWHLLRRCSYGPTADSIADARRLGLTGWLNAQLAPSSIPDPVADSVVARFPKLALDIAGVHAGVAAGTIQEFGWDLMFQLGQLTLARAAWSKRQLLEVMVDVWSNHLNVCNPFDGGWDNRHAYDRDVIRKYAFGRFADMLKASTVHPAMLTYLNNRESTKKHPNENYARELMELHTVGVNGGYTEADVQSAARLLTGLTSTWPGGIYRFDSAQHATGAVTIMGFSHPNSTAAGGEAAALAFVEYLAHHPATAHRIATKLCIRFVSDAPSDALVQQLADTYLAHDTAIAPMLRALFTSPEFWVSSGAKVRRPRENLLATVRTLGLMPEPIVAGSNPTGTKALASFYWMVDDTGDAPFNWATPDGYPDVAASWSSASATLACWNAHLSLAANWWPKEFSRPADLRRYLVPALPSTYGGLVDALAKRLLGTTMTAAHTAAVTQFVGKTPGSALTSTDAAVGWRFPYVVALILDSPYFSHR
jgi:hypothetical protein